MSLASWANSHEPPLLEVNLGAGVRAVFTSVHGGESTGPWRGLNLGLNTGDDPEVVLANRTRLSAVVGARVAFATQVHGTRVGTVAHVPTGSTVGEFDALMTTVPGLALGVLVADCVPILLADVDAQVCAVVHAGRVGLVAGVLPAAIAAMREVGAVPDRIRAAVGPSACGACYEVPLAMRDEVADQIPEVAGHTSWGTPSLDLAAGVDAHLRAGGIDRIERVHACTIEDPTYFSYRRAGRTGAPTGRFAGVISLN